MLDKEKPQKEISFSQEYIDFIREGPPGENTPADIIIELYEAVFNATDDMIE